MSSPAHGSAHSGDSGRALLPLPDFGVSNSTVLSEACSPFGHSGNSGKVWTGKSAGASTGSPKVEGVPRLPELPDLPEPPFSLMFSTWLDSGKESGKG